MNNMLLSVSVFFSRMCICVQNMCAQGKFWKDTREIVETLPVESMTEGLEEHCDSLSISAPGKCKELLD